MDLGECLPNQRMEYSRQVQGPVPVKKLGTFFKRNPALEAQRPWLSCPEASWRQKNTRVPYQGGISNLQWQQTRARVELRLMSRFSFLPPARTNKVIVVAKPSGPKQYERMLYIQEGSTSQHTLTCVRLPAETRATTKFGTTKVHASDVLRLVLATQRETSKLNTFQRTDPLLNPSSLREGVRDPHRATRSPWAGQISGRSHAFAQSVRLPARCNFGHSEAICDSSMGFGPALSGVPEISSGTSSQQNHFELAQRVLESGGGTGKNLEAVRLTKSAVTTRLSSISISGGRSGIAAGSCKAGFV